MYSYGQRFLVFRIRIKTFNGLKRHLRAKEPQTVFYKFRYLSITIEKFQQWIVCKRFLKANPANSCCFSLDMCRLQSQVHQRTLDSSKSKLSYTRGANLCVNLFKLEFSLAYPKRILKTFVCGNRLTSIYFRTKTMCRRKLQAFWRIGRRQCFLYKVAKGFHERK